MSLFSVAAVRRRAQGLGRKVYGRLPARWRDPAVRLAYANLGFLFRGMGHYELWRCQKDGDEDECRGRRSAGMADIRDFEPASMPPEGRIAVHAHVFYPDLAAEFASFFRNMPFRFDLFVSVTGEEGRRVCESAFSDLARLENLYIAEVENRGRDIAPMFCEFGARLASYEYLAHVHTKKSLYNDGASYGWREYLLRGLFGSEERIRRVFTALQSGAGMVFPQTFSRIPYVAGGWLANRGQGMAWCGRLGVRAVPEGYFDFPVGSMFWARTEALRPLFEAGITLEDFEAESGQTDGTFAHALERLLGVVANDTAGITILRDEGRPSWSRWRFDQYICRDRVWYERQLQADGTELIIFDVFDTLLVRPLLDAEQVKELVACRLGELGEVYRRFRRVAEMDLRRRSSRDVGLAEIAGEMCVLAGLGEEHASVIARVEEETECSLVRAREGASVLLKAALDSGRKVVLLSDMYLSSVAIARMLEAAGLSGWHELRVSSETGGRKDNALAYQELLQDKALHPGQVLVLGDNERSDFQIPTDLGMRSIHVLKAVDLARGHPRFGEFLARAERGEGGLNRSFSLGLIVQKLFAPLLHEEFDVAGFLPRKTPYAIGYSIAGPVLFAFVQWLREQALQDGVERLYFLSREGQIIKSVFDRVWMDVPGPETRYLVVSRRAVNVPAITDFDDIREISAGYFGPASLESFLEERFGIAPDSPALKEIYVTGAWTKGRDVMVRDGDIDGLLDMLRVAQPWIMKLAAVERASMMAYLDGMEIDASGAHAVVDIGYSGTIQTRLNALLGGGVHAYYMATDKKAARVQEGWNVRARGCFQHLVEPAPFGPILLKHGFLLEKLLSADNPQVVRYRQEDGEEPAPCYRELSSKERSSARDRAAVREGIFDFVADAKWVLQSAPEFKFPVVLAQELFEEWVLGGATDGGELNGLVLDDHYCGRGVV